MDSETRFHRIVRWFQDHKVFAWISVLVAVVAGAGTVVGSIDTIVRVYNDFFRQTDPPIMPINKADILAIPPPASYGYLYDVEGNEVEQLPGNPDYLDHPAISELRLYEGRAPLGHPHSSHEQIIEKGSGRYSHWRDDKGQEYILFSSSDNSDPRSNGREYMLVAATGQHVELDKGKIKHHERRNFGLRFRGDQLTVSPANSDCDGASQVSKLELLEIVNGQTKKLGPPHSPRHDIEKHGEGRYNHCKDGTTVWLFFSTSGNTDPRGNGRDYALTVKNE